MKLAFLLICMSLLLVVSPTTAMAWDNCTSCADYGDCYNGHNSAGLSCDSACVWDGDPYFCSTSPGFSTFGCCAPNIPEDTCPTVCKADDGCYPDPPYGIRNGYSMKCSDTCLYGGTSYTCQVGNGGNCCGNSIWCSECEGLCKSQGTPCQEDPYTSGTCPAPPVPPCPGGGSGGCDCGSQQNGYTVDLYLDCVINENYVPNEYVYTRTVQYGHTVSYPDQTEECGEYGCPQPYCQEEGWEADPYGWFYTYEDCCNFWNGCGPTYSACPEE